VKLPKIVREYPEISLAIAGGIGAVAVVGIGYAIARAFSSWPSLGDSCSLELYQDILGNHGVTPTVAERAWQYMPWVRHAAGAFGISSAFLAGVAHTESNWIPTAGSSAGAVGLTQFIASTASSVQRKLVEQGNWPFGALDRTDPKQSLWLSASLLSSMLRDHDVDWTLAAYNAGPGAANSGNWPAETQEYVPAVLRRRGWYEEIDQLCRDGWG
jgi:soluble lytic murein transglycosylase-like protein